MFDPVNSHITQEQASYLKRYGIINDEQYKEYKDVENYSSWTQDITSGLTLTALIVKFTQNRWRKLNK